MDNIPQSHYARARARVVIGNLARFLRQLASCCQADDGGFPSRGYGLWIASLELF